LYYHELFIILFWIYQVAKSEMKIEGISLWQFAILAALLGTAFALWLMVVVQIILG